MINIDIDDEFQSILRSCEDSGRSPNTIDIDDLLHVSNVDIDSNSKTWTYNEVRRYVRGDTSIRKLIPCRCILDYYYKSTFDSNNFLHETSSTAQKELDKIIEFRHHRVDEARTDPAFACTMSEIKEYLDNFFLYMSSSDSKTDNADHMHLVSSDGDENYCTDLTLYEKIITDFLLSSFNFDDSNLFSLIKLHNFCDERY